MDEMSMGPFGPSMQDVEQPGLGVRLRDSPCYP